MTKEAVCPKCVEQGFQLFPHGLAYYEILCRFHAMLADMEKKAKQNNSPDGVKPTESGKQNLQG